MDTNSTSLDPFVYVIDTDTTNRRRMASLLQESGVDHLVYDSTTIFLDRYEDRGPGCVLVDMKMPVISGFQLMHRMRGRKYLLSTILMTSHNDVRSVIRGFREGAADIFTKPIREPQMLERIHFEIKQNRSARTRHQRIETMHRLVARLTDREKQVMGLLVKGDTNKKIAWRLKLSAKTVGAHRCNIMNKLEVQSLAQMISLSSVETPSDILSNVA